MFFQNTVPFSATNVQFPVVGGAGMQMRAGSSATGSGFFFEGFFVTRLRPVVVLVLAITCLLVVCCRVVRPAGERVTAKQLANESEKYVGSRVLLDTKGCEMGSDPDTIIYRRDTRPGPPAVLVRFVVTLGKTMPPKVDGVVEGGSSPVVVVGARPVW